LHVMGDHAAEGMRFFPHKDEEPPPPPDPRVKRPALKPVAPPAKKK
jgi:hypothetical protein